MEENLKSQHQTSDMSNIIETEDFPEENEGEEYEEGEEENHNDVDLTSFSYSDCQKLLTSKSFYFKIVFFSRLI